MKYMVKPVRYWFPAAESHPSGTCFMKIGQTKPTHMQICHQTFDARIGN